MPLGFGNVVIEVDAQGINVLRGTLGPEVGINSPPE